MTDILYNDFFKRFCAVFAWSVGVEYRVKCCTFLE